MGLWTPEHAATLLPAVVVMIAISLLLRKWLINKSFETRMIPVKVIAVLLLLLELGKQAVSISRGYDLYHLPFHFCSLFLFMMPAMPSTGASIRKRSLPSPLPCALPAHC